MGSVKLSSVVLLLLSLFLFSGNMVEVEGKTCSQPSGKFHGACFYATNCASVCGTEGFPDGTCDNRFRCMCRKSC
ncbi:hypothetical protein QJS10_CPB15g00130 [Acorus calamus]|uniref:Knottins-like domain-containing protein n=1 Tax=Acorus calamus TaxID=4465 RepID=A0AAV9D8Y1_ACOCL|nr:hypothetical protein QJS10_CPB15g00130 [Acorus calamus]